MKKLSLLLLASLFIAPIWAQNDSIPEATEIEESKIEVPEIPMIEEIEEIEEILLEAPDKTEIKLGEDELFIIEENGDTTKLQLGSKGISMIENEDGVSINVIDMEEDKKDKDNEEENEKENKRKKKFKGHFGGFEMGINNYLTADNSLQGQNFMTLNTSRSYNFNLNFLEYGFGLGTSYAGLVTGMGIEWSSYVFDANNSIQEAADGTIQMRDAVAEFNGITKSKLSTTYLTAPLLLEFQIPAGKKRIHLSGGVIGGVKIGSKTKIKYNDGGKQKDVRKDDFSLSPFRYGAHVRVGYRSLNLFATYYITPLFGEVATPELYPFSIGLTLIPF